MTARHLLPFVLAGSMAVVAVSLAFVFSAREGIARSEAAAIEAKRDAAADELRAAEEQKASEEVARQKAESEARAAEANAKAQEEAARMAEEQTEQKALDLERKKEERLAKEAEMKAAEAARETARLQLEAARLTNEVAKTTLERVQREHETAAFALEAKRLEAEKVLKEAELRATNVADLVQWERDLIDLARELKEREDALTPEKTIADLVWLPDETTEIDENGRLRSKKTTVLPEDNPELTPEARALARQTRLALEAQTNAVNRMTQSAIRTLENLYVKALKADRPDQARSYKKAIKAIDPLWVYQAPQKESKQTNVVDTTDANQNGKSEK